MRNLLIIAITAITFAGCGTETTNNKTETTNTPAPDFTSLQKELDSIAKTIQAGFSLGYINMETGDTFSYNGNAHKPMQSTVKFPLALMVLQMVDSGKLALDQVIAVTDAEMKPYPRSPFRDSLMAKTHKATVYDMLYYMVAFSDNVTCDKFTQMVGGVEALEAYTHQLGMEGIGMIPKKDNAGAIDFGQPYENWCEAPDMAMLLAKFYKGEILSKTSTDTLRSIMERAQRERIKGLLPKGTIVAHKTGTGGTENYNLK